MSFSTLVAIFIIIPGDFMLLFDQSAMRITAYIALGNSFYICDVWRGSCRIFVHYISNSENSVHWYPNHSL